MSHTCDLSETDNLKGLWEQVKTNYLTLSSKYIPAVPCQPAGAWTQRPGCHPSQRVAEPDGTERIDSETTGLRCFEPFK